jgi:hypothetical protein
MKASTLLRPPSLLAGLLFLNLAIFAGCSQGKMAESAETGSTTSQSTGERLLADAPSGWKEVFNSDNPGLRMVEFIPENESNASWQHKITFESLKGKPLPDPIEFLKGLSADQSGTCEGFESFSTFSGFENGYPTTVRLMVCKRSDIINQSQVTMLKAIQGKENFYVITRAQRGPPLADDTAALTDEEMAGWALYLKAISVCDDTTEQACPKPD